MLFKFLNNTSPDEYINDVSKPSRKPSTTTRVSLLKLHQPLRKTDHAQKSISYIAPTILKNLPNSLFRIELRSTSK